MLQFHYIVGSPKSLLGLQAWLVGIHSYNYYILSIYEYNISRDWLRARTSHPRQLSTTDILALRSMKNAAKCDT